MAPPAPLAVALVLLAGVACVVAGPSYTLVHSVPWGGGGSNAWSDGVLGAGGLVWAVGETTSADFPLGGAPASHMQPAHGGGKDCVLAAWRPGDNSVVAATFIGWEGDETNCQVAAGPDGLLWVAATTTGSMRNATDGSVPEGGDSDIVVVGVQWESNTNALSLEELFYVGGGARDELAALRVDAADGTLHVVGTVRDNVHTAPANASARLPAATTELNAPGDVRSGDDGLYVQLDDVGNVLFAVLVGGDGDDSLADVAWSADAVWLVGHTHSSALFGTLRTDGAAHADGVVVQLARGDLSVAGVRVMGGSADDALTHVCVTHVEERGGAEVVVAAGWTRSADGPANGTLAGAQEALVAMWAVEDMEMLAAELVGGTGDTDHATALAPARNGSAVWLGVRTPSSASMEPLGFTVESVAPLIAAEGTAEAHAVYVALLEAGMQRVVSGQVSGGAAHALLPVGNAGELVVVGTAAPRGAVPVLAGAAAPAGTLSGVDGSQYAFVQLWARTDVACNGNQVCESDEACVCGDCAVKPECAAPGAPGMPTRIDGGLTFLEVAWTAPAAPSTPVGSYHVIWGFPRPPDETQRLEGEQIVNAPTTTLRVTGLVEDTDYFFEVVALGVTGRYGAWSERAILRTDAPCVPDCSLCVLDDGCGSPCATGACASATDVCRVGVCVPMPAAPADVQEGVVAGLTTIELQWAAVVPPGGEAAVDFYLVEWGVGATGTSFPSSQHVAAPATSLLLEGLTSATTYRFRVRAVNVDGIEGVPSAVVVIATVNPDACVPRCSQCGADDGCGSPCATGSCVHLGVLFECNADEARCEGPPQPPHAPTIVRAMPTRAWLEWEEPIDNFAAITHYIVERRHVDAGGGYTTVHTTDGPVRAYGDGGLTASHQYAYRMRAVNARGSSGVGGSTAVHLPGPAEPDAIAAFTLVSQSLTSLYFEWDAPVDNGAPILAYRVYAQRLPDNLVDPPVPGTDLVLAGQVTRTFYNAFGLDTGFEYRFVVESFNVIGVSNTTEVVYETLGAEARRDSADALGEEDIQALAFGLGGGSLLLSFFFAAYHWRRKSLKHRRDLQWGEREAHNPWEAKYDRKHENVDSRGYWFMAWAFLFLAVCGFVTGALWKDVLEDDPSAE